MKFAGAGTTPLRLSALVAFCAATVLLIPLEIPLAGVPAWVLAAYLCLREGDRRFTRRMLVLLGAVAVLGVAPINTDTSTPHFTLLASIFLAVILIPYLILKRTDPGVIRYQLFPTRFRWLDLFYVAISIPLAWGAFELYFKVVSPEVPFNWALPPDPVAEQTWRLFAGINGVGIWDELFFVNTVFAVLRSIFPFRIANLGQAVVYTAVLYDMAFTGLGPFLIYVFALTQGSMFEESENLLYVLIVHLIVDYFLLAGILHAYYPGQHLLPF